jgi:hypothetical protein
MAEGPDVIPLMRGGPLRKAGGCLVLLIVIAVELGIGLVAGGGAWAAAEANGLVRPGGDPLAAYLVTGTRVIAAMALFDWVAKQLLKVSPFRLLVELIMALPNVP